MSAFHQARHFLLEHRENYEQACAGFKWPELDSFNWALDYFDVMAQGNEQLALWIVNEDGIEERWTYAELARRSNQVANWLSARGVQRGDRVLLMLGNERALWEAMLGLMKLGAVLVPTTVLVAPGDLRDRLDRGCVRHVIAAADQTDKFSGLGGPYVRISVGSHVPGWLDFSDAYMASTLFEPIGRTDANDPLLLYFTSGTTSKPKLVLHSHQSYPVGHLSTMYWLGLRPGDVHLNISSPGWGKHAWSSFFAPWNAGACIFVYQYYRLQANALLDLLVRHGVTSLCAPPTVWRMLIQVDLSAWKVRLREVIGAGEPLNPKIIERVRAAWGVTLRDGFGQTETTCVIGNSPGQAVRPGSMGRAMPGYDVTLVDATGVEGAEGELCLSLNPRPCGLMRAYADDAQLTRDIMRDGRYRTGDIARREVDGYFTYVGRADDVFKSSDYRISPFELESVLAEHPMVVEAAVIPSPDPIRLNVPKAVIVLRDELVPDRAIAISVLRFARERLAPYKRVRRIEFASLPKTISGKIQRALLRRQEEEHVSHGIRNALEFYEEDFPELLKDG